MYDLRNEKRFLKGHDSLFRYELYKVRKGGRVGMILFLFLIVSCFLSYQSHLIFDDEDEYYYYTYMKQLEYIYHKRCDIKKEPDFPVPFLLRRIINIPVFISC